MAEDLIDALTERAERGPADSAELRARLLQVRQARPASHVYVLLDNACPVSSVHALHPDSLSLRKPERDRIAVGLPADSEETRSWRPTLLQLYRSGESGYVDDELVETTWSCAVERHASINGAYVAAWIASDQSPSALAAQLARQSDCFDLATGRRANLHLHQPYRMALASAAPDDRGFLAMCMTGIHAWLYVDAACDLQTLHSPVDAPGLSARPSLALSRAFQRVPLGREVLMGIRQARLPIPRRAEPLIDGLLLLAAEQGLTHAEDVIFFALNMLSLSPQWFKHPQAGELIRQAATDGASLVGLFSELPVALAEEIGTWRVGS